MTAALVITTIVKAFLFIWTTYFMINVVFNLIAYIQDPESRGNQDDAYTNVYIRAIHNQCQIVALLLIAWGALFRCQ